MKLNLFFAALMFVIGLYDSYQIDVNHNFHSSAIMCFFAGVLFVANIETAYKKYEKQLEEKKNDKVTNC